MISQSSTNSTEIIEGFVQQGGIEKLLELSQIQPIAGELSVSTFTNSIANILQNLLVSHLSVLPHLLFSFRPINQPVNV